MRETQIQSLGQEDPLEKEMETHSSTLAWKIPWTEEPGRLQSMGSQRVRLDWATSLSLFFTSSIWGCWFFHMLTILFSFLFFEAMLMVRSDFDFWVSLVINGIEPLFMCFLLFVYLWQKGVSAQFQNFWCQFAGILYVLWASNQICDLQIFYPILLVFFSPSW